MEVETAEVEAGAQVQALKGEDTVDLMMRRVL
jgi:hypothetical protein